MLNIDFDKLIASFLYNPKEPLMFNSGFFLFLFSGFILIYVLLKKQNTLRILYVIAFSYYFYYKTSGGYFFLMAAVTIWDYYIGLSLSLFHKKSMRKFLVFLSILGNLGLLCYFKYTNFVYEHLCDFSGKAFTPFNIFLPIGISFYTFQSMSYTIDIYRKKIKPTHNLWDYAFFVSFFPQLVAGPIIRAKDFLPQIHRPLLVTRNMFGRGVYLIAAGLLKKAVISDYISINFVDRIFDNPSLYSGIENLFGIYGYALQIYCDFSGYSDMAIGIALLLGFRFNENFDSPYKSATITEFWKRWHISLSSWLKDYLYIPLGGNRKGKIRTYINLMITLLLGGLWHGASLRFILWGGLHGATLVIHKIFLGLFPFLKSTGNRMKPVQRFLGILLTFHIVCFGWIFFRAHTMDSAIAMMQQIATNFRPELFVEMIKGYPYVFLLMFIGFVTHYFPQGWKRWGIERTTMMPLICKALLLVIVIVIISYVKSAQIQPFIYFQF
ncbi:MAG: MBOAT family protein [Dysgonamonadaceae bacterium]|jgi:D-alanyl-lipoteichoic acid acyltransferase DltB (MBOAT superfamily)|nr:MBOAT family protein [Dysgonamonadaceae bacterium]